ncbi:MAG: glycosyl transferase [Pirellula sp.]|nr:glycosyl transferase [Pirellula sp.]
MRIAIIAEVYLPKVDGVVIRTMNLIRQLLERGDEVLVVCPEAVSERKSPVPIVEFRSFPFPAYPEYRIGLPDGRLVDELRSFQPDVVHFLNPFAFGFRCYDILSRTDLDLPCVFSFHTLYGEFVKRYGLIKPLSRVLWWLMRDYHNCADTNLTVSTIMQSDLQRRGFERVEFWPPAVDASLFHPDRRRAEMRKRLSAGHPNEPLLLTVSRLAPEKSVGLLAEMLQRVPGARLAIVGDGPQREQLERMFPADRTNFVGYMTGAELADAYAAADMFVFASETETMGNVVLEAMASGLPVVAPRAGGIPSLVREGETALLYQPGNATEAAGLVNSLLADDAQRLRISSAGRSQAEAWDWHRSAEKVREHYRRTILEHRVGSERAEKDRRLARAVLTSLTWAFRTAAVFPQRRKSKVGVAASTP